MTYKIVSSTEGTLHEGDKLREALAVYWETVWEGGDSFTYSGPTITLWRGDTILKQIPGDKPRVIL